MFIYMLGWHWEHKEGFAIERPDGHFGTQLIVVQSKGRIVMGDREYRVGKNTAFLVKSCMPHCLYSDGEDYCDDWIRFNLEQEDMEFIDGLGLEYNVPINLKDNSISKLIAACEEIFNSDIAEKKAILDSIMRAIILELNGCCSPREKTKHNYYSEEFEKVRREIYAHPEREWNIPDIAAEYLRTAFSAPLQITLWDILHEGCMDEPYGIRKAAPSEYRPLRKRHSGEMRLSEL